MIAGVIVGLHLDFFDRSKNLNFIGAVFFLKICSHIFMDLNLNWSEDFGHT